MLLLVIILIIIIVIILFKIKKKNTRPCENEIENYDEGELYLDEEQEGDEDAHYIMNASAYPVDSYLNMTHHIAQKAMHSFIVMDYAFFAETVYYEFDEIKNILSSIDVKDDNNSLLNHGICLSEFLSSAEKRYNECILRAIKRQYEGYQLVVVFLQSHAEIIEYTTDMYTQINRAKKILQPIDNKDEISNELDKIYYQVEEFCSPFLSVPDKECLINAKNLKNYCVGLMMLSEKQFNDDESDNAIRALDEAARYGWYPANKELLYNYTNTQRLDNYKFMEDHALYRLCIMGAVHGYRHAQESILKAPEYKDIIIKAMSYGTSVCKSLCNDKVILYGSVRDLHDFMINNYIELSTGSVEDFSYYDKPSINL